MSWDFREGLGNLMFGLVFFGVFIGITLLFGGESGSSSGSNSPYEESATTDIQQVVPATEYSTWSWSNCTEARGAGAAPVYASEEGYGRHLDRDGDGVGCE